MKKLCLLILLLTGAALGQATPANANSSYVGNCFLPGNPNCGPSLLKLIVTPANPTIIVGQTLQFQAEGTMRDASDAGPFGPQCDGRWSSSNQAVATIGFQGLATALTAGTTTITCTLNTFISGNTLLTVNPTPTITQPTCSPTPCVLPQGTNGQAYNFTFQGTPAGGTWSVTVGALPGWASLNSASGVLSGTAATGSTSFTVTYTKSGTASLPVTLNVTGTTGCGPFTFTCASTNNNIISVPSTAPAVGNALSGAGSLFTDPIFGTQGVRVTDGVTTDPSMTGNSNDTFSFSNGGSADDVAFSTDDRLLFVTNNGGTKDVIAMNPSTMAISRPYSTLTSGCPRGTGNCSTYGGFSTADKGGLQFSKVDPCRLWYYPFTSTTFGYYEFGSDVSSGFGNTCSGAIHGAPAFTTQFNWVESNGNCLPTNFGSPTWTSNAGTVTGDTRFAVAFSSVAYHISNNGGTGQNTGFYVVIYDTVKGCLAINTSTMAITADLGWSGPGFTCNSTGCTASMSSPATFVIHNVKFNTDGSVLFIANEGTLTGTATADTPFAYPVGGTTLYESEVTKTSGHWCGGALGLINNPGSPLFQWYYRTEGATSSGTPIPLLSIAGASPTSIDSHCGWIESGALDQNPFYFATTTNGLGKNGGGEFPFDAPLGPWFSEIDFGGVFAGGQIGCILGGAACPIYREAFTFNTNQENFFSSQNNIIACSQTGKFCGTGSGWFNLRNAAGTQAGCGVNGTCSASNCIPSGPAWLVGKVYPTNYVVAPTNNNTANSSFQINNVSGLPAPTEPNWNTSCATVGSTCVWTGTVSGHFATATATNIGVSSGANQCGVDAYVWKMQ